MIDRPDDTRQSPPVPGRIAELLEDLITEIEEARAVPLSNNVMVNQDEFLDQLHRAAEELPEEIRAARWMVRERESYIARTNEKARDVITKAQEESARLVSQNYVVQEAVEEANTLVRNAENEARRIRLEAEDYAERHLAEAETVLGELYRYVTEARAELHKALPPMEAPPILE
jgi:vacuolar-type H+-ATPase subunit H